jgi:hypothetical protein
LYYVDTEIIKTRIVILHASISLFVTYMTDQEIDCIKCRVRCASSVDKLCYFCWYNFEATSEEQKEIQDSESFREKSVNIVACNRLGRLDEALECDI